MQCVYTYFTGSQNACSLFLPNDKSKMKVSQKSDATEKTDNRFKIGESYPKTAKKFADTKKNIFLLNTVISPPFKFKFYMSQ